MKKINADEILYHTTAYKFKGMTATAWRTSARHPATLLQGIGESEIDSEVSKFWALDDLVWKLRKANEGSTIEGANLA